MRPKPSPDALAQQLLLLTYALDHALGREDWEESNSLFLRREEILGQLERLPRSTTSNETLDRIQLLEANMIERLRSMQIGLARDHKAEIDSHKARRAYHDGATTLMLDEAS